MKMNFAILFSLTITIFGLPRAFAAGSSQEDSGEPSAPRQPQPFDLDGAKQLLVSMLHYVNGFKTLSNYQTIENGINNATDADKVIKAGRKILDGKGVQGKLVDAAEKDQLVAETMIQKIDSYTNAFWNLLNDTDLDGSDIPLATRLGAIRKKCVDSLPYDYDAQNAQNAED